MNLIYKLYWDKTGFEASNNHIHISQYLDDNKSPIEGLQIAMYMLDAWKTKLKKDFLADRFHLILSCNCEESTLRFHKYRQNEGSWATIDDL